MRFEPLFAWWLLLPLTLASLIAISYYLVRRWQKSRRLPSNWIYRGIMLLLLTLMLIGPSLPGGTTSPGVANLDVIYAVDTTASMGALDYNGNKQRVEGLKNDLTALGKNMKGAHMTIITFDSKAAVLLPSTSDYATFTSVVHNLTPELYNTSNGSSIDKPIELIVQQLKNSKAAYPDRKRLLFYLSDGEQTTDKPIKSFASISKLPDGGAVMGYGTAKGAQMIRYTGLQNKGDVASFITTPDSATKKFVPAISKLNESNLKKIASDIKLPYANRNRGGEVSQLLTDSRTRLMLDKSKKVTHYVSIYWLLAVPLAVLLFWEWQRVFMHLVILSRTNRGSKHAQ